MDTTAVRRRALSALIVGATGINVLRVVTAFEGRRILALRADDVASACERIPVDMPHVVLLLVPPRDEDERDALRDRALAVGALVVEVAPGLGDAAFQELLERAVASTLERRRPREARERYAGGSTVSEAPPPEEIDGGWDD